MTTLPSTASGSITTINTTASNAITTIPTTTKPTNPSPAFYTLPSHLDGDARRLNQQHQVFRLLLAAATDPPPPSTLLITPLPDSSNAQTFRVLDLGTGTGIWAAEFALEHPAASVLGIDLFPPSFEPRPPNCSYAVLNAEGNDAEWDALLPPGTFDLIHTRMFLMTLRDSKRVVERIHRALRRGGRVEFQEKQDPYRSLDEEEEQERPLLRHSRLRIEAAMRCGLDRTVTRKIPLWMEQLGFEHVISEEKRIPIGGWMEGSEVLKVAGEKWRECIAWGTLGFCRQVFMEGFGWSEEQVLENVREAVEDLGKGRVYGAIMFITGRKGD